MDFWGGGEKAVGVWRRRVGRGGRGGETKKERKKKGGGGRKGGKGGKGGDGVREKKRTKGEALGGDLEKKEEEERGGKKKGRRERKKRGGGVEVEVFIRFVWVEKDCDAFFFVDVLFSLLVRRSRGWC